MKKSKRITAIILCVIVLTGCVTAGVLGFAAEQEFEPNKLILEDIYANRQWVLDTLMTGEYRTNPYFDGPWRPMMIDALEDYEDDTAYKVLVNALYYFYNLDDLPESLFVDGADALLSLFSAEESELGNKVHEYCNSLSDEVYESILNDVFTTNYTSSYGISVMADNDSLQELNSIKKNVKAAKALMSFIKDTADFKDFDNLTLGYYPTTDDEVKRFGSYSGCVDGYSDALDTFSDYFGDTFGELTDDKSFKAKCGIFSALSFIRGFQLFELETSKNFEFEYSPFISTEFAPSVSAFADIMADGFSFENIALENYILVEQLYDQKDVAVSFLERLHDEITTMPGIMQDDMQGYRNMLAVVNDYRDLVSDEYDNRLINYNTIADFVKSKNWTFKGVKTLAKKSSKLFLDDYDKYKLELVGEKLGMESVSQVLAAAQIATWIADKTTNIKDTAKKIFELKYLNDYIETVKHLYASDYMKYRSNPTDENAKICLDDLQMLKRFRLRGEEITYKMMQGQLNSALGRSLLKLQGDDMNYADAWETRYKHSCDMLIGATLSPFSMEPYKLTGSTSAALYGDKGCYCLTDDGSYIGTIGEFDRRITGGLSLSNSNMTFSNRNGECVYLPILIVSGNCKLRVQTSAAVTVGEIYFAKANSTLELDAVDGGYITVSENVDFAYSGCSVTGTGLKLDGKIEGTGSIAKLLINDNKDKSVSAVLNVGELTLNTSGRITFNEQLRVSSVLTDTKSKIRKPSNLVLTGNAVITGGVYNKSLTLSGWNCTAPTEFGTDIYLSGSNTVNSNLTVKGDISLLSGSGNSLTVNGKLKAYGDFTYGGTFSGGGNIDIYKNLTFTGGSSSGNVCLNIYGDASFTGATTLSRLAFCGSEKQVLEPAASLTVAEFYNRNTSLGGLYVNKQITVTNLVSNESGRFFKNGKNILLNSQCKLSPQPYNGNIGASGWTVTQNTDINGTLFPVGNITLNENVTVNVNEVTQNTASATVKTGAVLNVSGSAVMCSVNGNGKIISYDDASFSGTVSSLTVDAGGDACFTGTVSSGNIKVAGNAEISGAATGGNFEFSGNASFISESNVTSVVFSGTVAQKYTAVNKVTTAKFYNRNTVPGGLDIANKLYVTDVAENDTARFYKNGKNIVLTSNCKLSPQPYNGNIGASGWTVTQNTDINGTLYAVGDVTLAEDVQLNTFEYLQTGGTTKVNNGAKLSVNGTALFNNISGNGEISVSDDASVNGSVASADIQINGNAIFNSAVSSGKIEVRDNALFNGSVSSGTLKVCGNAEFKSAANPSSLEVLGNLSLASSANINTLTLSGTAAQTFTASSEISAANLIFNNLSGGITLDGVINVSSTYVNNTLKVIHPENVHLGSGCIKSGISSTQGNYYVTSALVLPDDTDFTFNGNVVLSGSGSLTVGANSSVSVNGYIKATAVSVTVPQGSSLYVNDYIFGNTLKCTLNGDLTVMGDISLSGGSVSGDGKLVSFGDIYASNTTFTGIDLALNAAVPQKLSGTSFSFGDITLNNTSADGVDFASAVKYGGVYSAGATNVTGLQNLTFAE